MWTMLTFCQCAHRHSGWRWLLKRLSIAVVCLLASAATLAPVAGGAVQIDCPVIYDGGNGWLIDMCDTDPAVLTPMEIVLDGTFQGNAALMRVYHKSQSWPGTPQVAIIYASGFVRLKQNADPSPSTPSGQGVPGSPTVE